MVTSISKIQFKKVVILALQLIQIFYIRIYLRNLYLQTREVGYAWI